MEPCFHQKSLEVVSDLCSLVKAIYRYPLEPGQPGFAELMNLRMRTEEVRGE